MREFKFRSWNIKDKIMTCNINLGDAAVNFTGYIIMQFTGLKDKNGKEIYEGDILAPMPNDYNPAYKGIWIIQYNRGAYEAVSPDDRTATWTPYWTEYQMEVIGNIYENPELLK